MDEQKNKKNNKEQKKRDLDDFPNQCFAGAMAFVKDPSALTDEEREMIAEEKRRHREMLEARKRREREWESKSEEEKQAIEQERREREAERDEGRWERFQEGLRGKELDEQAVRAIETIGDRIWRGNEMGRTPYPSDDESGFPLLRPELLLDKGMLGLDLPRRGERHDKAVAISVAQQLDGIAIGRHEEPISLWLYNMRSPYVEDRNGQTGTEEHWRDQYTYMLVSPRDIAQAEEDGDRDFLSALDYLCERHPVIYDERAGDGYDYMDAMAKQTWTGRDGQEHSRDVHIWKLAEGSRESIEDIVPPEAMFMRESVNVSFITDHYSSFYHDKKMKQDPPPVIYADGHMECEYEPDPKGFTDEEIAELSAPGSAFWRMYHDGGFEHLITRTCLDDEDRAYLDEIMGNAKGRIRFAWRVSFSCVAHPPEKTEQQKRIERAMKDAIIVWDHTAGSPKAMYDLMDESPTDGEIYAFMDEWMRESGCRELVMRVQSEGKSIWDLMRERDDEKNLLGIAVDFREDEDVEDEENGDDDDKEKDGRERETNGEGSGDAND